MAANMIHTGKKTVGCIALATAFGPSMVVLSGIGAGAARLTRCRDRCL
ncbi:hypothetical protein [Streptomyces sp. NPDC058694]